MEKVVFAENLVHINNAHFKADVTERLFGEPVTNKNRKWLIKKDSLVANSLPLSLSARYLESIINFCKEFHRVPNPTCQKKCSVFVI